MTTKRIPFLEPWTADRVMARMKEAAVALRSAAGGSPAPSQRITWWPDIVRDRAEGYGYTPVGGTRQAGAAADQIERMDHTLQWISAYLSRPACLQAGLVEDSGWLVWARALGWSFARIGTARKLAWGAETRGGGPSMSIPGGNARPSLLKIERAALGHVASMLNRGGEMVDRDARAAEPDALRAGPGQRQAPAVQGIRAIAPERGPAQYEHLDDEDAGPAHARTRSTGAR